MGFRQRLFPKCGSGLSLRLRNKKWYVNSFNDWTECLLDGVSIRETLRKTAREVSILIQRDGLLGWATARLIHHDGLAPGVIRRLLASGPMRRQTVFLTLASEVVRERHLQIVGGEPDRAEAVRRAEVLRDGRAGDVVAVATDRVPDGLLGALERVGLKPLRDPRLYARLCEVYLRPDQRCVADALRHVGQITPTMLRIIDLLPPELTCPVTLKRLDSPSEAAEFVESVELAQAVNSRATDKVLRESLDRLPEHVGLETFVSRFIRRADIELHAPVAADNEITPVLTVKDMIWTGRSWRNCLATDPKIIGALLGRRAYARFRNNALLEFAPLTNGGWLYLQCHGHANLPVAQDVEDAARAKVIAAGVACVPVREPRGGRFSQFTVPGDSTYLMIAA